MSFSGGLASDVMSGSDTALDTCKDGEGRECRFVSIDKERKQHAVNFKRDFLLHVAEEIMRFKVNDQVQARVEGRQEMDGGRKPQEKNTTNRREKNMANSRRKGQEETHLRPQVMESGEKLERRRAGASSIVTRDQRQSCEEAAALKIIQWSICTLAKL